VRSVSYIPYLQIACRGGVSHSSPLSIDFIKITLTFSSPFCPLPSLPQELHPLSLITSYLRISQPSTATREEQEEASGKIRYSALKSLDGPMC
jgi:hypothetical protein